MKKKKPLKKIGNALSGCMMAAYRTSMRILVFVLLCMSMGVVCAHADSLSQAKLEELMVRFPDGAYWEYSDETEQYRSFVRRMAYEYYGVSCGEQSRSDDFTRLKAGDLVCCREGNTDRFIWVTAVNGNTVTYAECSADDPGRISWNQTTALDQLQRSFLYLEQAPDAQKEPDGRTEQLYEGETGALFTSDLRGGEVFPKAAAGKKTEIRLNKTSLTVYVGGSASLTASVSGTSSAVVWSSSNKTVATVKNGKVTGKKAGTAVITAKANGKTATCKVTVKNPSIKLNKKNATIYTSGTTSVTLKAEVAGPSKKVTWKSSNPSVAKVNSQGKVTAKKAGTAVITAAANGKTAKCQITVKKKTVYWETIEFNSYENKPVKVGNAVFSAVYQGNSVMSWYVTTGGKETFRLKAANSWGLQPDISTNGSEIIYYSFDGKKAEFYQVSVKGGSSKKVGTVTSVVDGFEFLGYCNGKIYYTVGFDASRMYACDIKSGKHKLISKECDYRPKLYRNYIFLSMNEGEGGYLRPLSIYNTTTGKTSKITSALAGYNYTSKYIYYAEYKTYRFGGESIVVVKRCKFNGTGKKTLADNIKLSYITKFSRNSISYVDMQGKTKTIKF